LTNIVVVFPRIADAKSIRNLLVKNGFHVSATVSTGAAVLELVDEMSDGLVISGYKLPDMIYTQMHELLPPGIEHMLIASREHITEGDGNIVCFEMPIKIHDLINTVSMIVEGIESKRRKKRQTPTIRDDESKKIITEAKVLLMERNNLTEEEAHRYLQKTSMNSGTNMFETAQKILSLMR